MEKQNLELLTSIYQNCRIGVQSIQDIEPSVEDENLRAELREELEQYNNFAVRCEKIAKEYEEILPDNHILEKARLWTSIKMTTLTDKSTRHLAEMLLLGSVMGTLQCYKDLADFKGADKELLELCGELQQLQEKNFNYLKMFLKEM